MKATAQVHDVSSGFRAVTLLVEDFAAFPLGVQVEIEVKQIAQPQPPAEVAANVVELKQETKDFINGNPTNTNPESCDLCKGSGVVAVFPDGATEGVPTRCDNCRGTGMKNPPSPPTA